MTTPQKETRSRYYIKTKERKAWDELMDWERSCKFHANLELLRDKLQNIATVIGDEEDECFCRAYYECDYCIDRWKKWG